MYNHIGIQGRLTADPELRTTMSGAEVVNFSVACERDFLNKTTGTREVDYIKVVAWNGTAKFVANNFRKGQLIFISGRLQLKDWTDDNGVKHRESEILASNLYFGDSKKSRDEMAASANPDAGYGYETDTPYTGSQGFAPVPDDDGDLPW